MKYLVYECFECGSSEVSKDMDGCRCSECSGAIYPKREATNEEVKALITDKIKKRRESMNNPPNGGSSVIKPSETVTELKLKYLSELWKSFGEVKLIEADIANRMLRVCDSIEADLGIRKD
ncbi:hypothetical protein COLU111180_11925 [Cohnella lubricantis]|uniref:Uncharacterized protein n=1 Tax=Cohnella lubricantis TaxID=2163172 RepID=A0A841TC25_9BACL|nr:hypothetical protein [Cohnella lubricantis]MBB6675991.1 hypothetical protein [Cohnella lubricantis]MBP2117890.1 DNA-directed RNA polymerase subunit RPC12/RpoP [Cohnella lubricantis]